MASEPVRDSSVQAAPKDYSIRAAQEVRLLSVRASFTDNGATVDWLPALQILDNSGNVLVTATDQGVKITAGSDADVSWFPGMKPSTVSAANVKFVGARIEAHATQDLTSATATDLVYDTVAFDTDGMANLGANNRILTVNTSGIYALVCATTFPWNSAGRRLNVITRNVYYSAAPAPGNQLVGDSRNAIWTPLTGPDVGSLTPAIAVTIAQLSAGDFIASGALQESGSTLAVNGYAGDYLAAALVGVT